MTDSTNAIFEPDVLLSAELQSPRTGLPEPERALLLAVLEDAARSLVKTCTATTDRRRIALYDETRDWFASTEHVRLFDFENVCNVLGIEPGYLRRRLFDQCERLRALALASDDTGDDVAPIRDDELLSA